MFMTYPIECSDEYGLQGVENADDIASWLNSWMRDKDSTRCVIEKVLAPSTELNPDAYTLAPAQAGEQS